MSIKDPAGLAQYLRSGKRVLIMAGALCDEIDFNGKSLLDYAADIAKKTNAPVAATGNTVNGLRERGVETNKSWAAEIVNFMKYDWNNPLMEGKPEVLLLIGYSPTMAANLASSVRDSETVVLGGSYVEEATYSLPTVKSFTEWQGELTELVKAL